MGMLLKSPLTRPLALSTWSLVLCPVLALLPGWPGGLDLSPAVMLAGSLQPGAQGRELCFLLRQGVPCWLFTCVSTAWVSGEVGLAEELGAWAGKADFPVLAVLCTGKSPSLLCPQPRAWWGPVLSHSMSLPRAVAGAGAQAEGKGD